MKLRKQIKNRVVAVLMLASLALCFLSYFDLYSVQASSFYSYDRYSGEPDKDGNVSHSVTQVQSTSDIAPTYLMLYHPYEEGKNSFIYVLLAIGKGGFKAPKCSSVGDDGSVSNYDAQYVGSAGSGLDNYNCYVIEAQFGGYLKYKSAGYCINVNIDEWNNFFQQTGSANKVYLKYVQKYLDNKDSFTYVTNGTYEIDSIPDGSQNNPYKKDNFGYPDIYNSNYLYVSPSSGGESDKLSTGQYFDWKRKSTTGFNLTKNDYNYTYIECKVKNCFQYNDNFSGKGDWHKYDSYGEMGSLGKVRAESLSHYYTFNDLMTALPKLESEMSQHTFKSMKSSYVFYFRIVCMKTSSTVVIPDEKDCKYYVGPWRSVDVSTNNGDDHKSVIEDGDFDDEGNWKKDDTSTDNGKDIDSGTSGGKDFDDAIDNSKKDDSSKSDLDLDSAKEFINQVADVPKMIGAIFSFFPDWVKYCFALGFALIPILIIYKLIRG